MFIRFVVRAAVASLLLGSVAEGSPPILELSAPGHCPTQAEFEDFVSTRLSAEPAYAGTRFEVDVSVVGTQHVATISATTASGESSQRTLEDPSCVELLKSVAFVIAVAVERERDELERKRAEATAPPVAPTPTPALPPPSAPLRARDEPTVTRVRSATTSPGPSLAVLAGVRGTAAPMPEFVPAARLAAALSFPRRAPAFSVYVSGLRTLSQSVNVDPTSPERGASFTWTAGALEGCLGTSSRPGVTVAIAGCAGAEIGVLSAEGKGVRPRLTRHRFWFSTVALGRLRFPADGPLGVELDAGAALPFTRDEFMIEGPETQVFKPPAVALSLGLALSLRVL